MSSAALSIRAHFDGKVIVPDEPVNLPLNSPLDIQVKAAPKPPASKSQAIASKLAALEQFMSHAKSGTSIPADALGRDQLYGDDGR
jgi:hypothetical protein